MDVILGAYLITMEKCCIYKPLFSISRLISHNAKSGLTWGKGSECTLWVFIDFIQFNLTIWSWEGPT